MYTSTSYRHKRTLLGAVLSEKVRIRRWKEKWNEGRREGRKKEIKKEKRRQEKRERSSVATNANAASRRSLGWDRSMADVAKFGPGAALGTGEKEKQARGKGIRTPTLRISSHMRLDFLLLLLLDTTYFRVSMHFSCVSVWAILRRRKCSYLSCAMNHTCSGRLRPTGWYGQFGCNLVFLLYHKISFGFPMLCILKDAYVCCLLCSLKKAFKFYGIPNPLSIISRYLPIAVNITC